MTETQKMAWNAPGSGKTPGQGQEPGQQQDKGKDDNPWSRRRPSGGSGGSGGGGGDFGELFNKLRGLFGTGKGGPTLLVVVALALWLASGFYTVDAAARGVITTFGKYTSTGSPGLHWHMPFPIQSVQQVNVGTIRNISDQALMLTQDENIVDLAIAAQYKVKDAENYLFSVKEPDTTLREALKSAVREVVGKEKMDFILTAGRAEIESRTRDILQAALDSYQAGLEVTTVNMKNAQPPQPVQDAFADAIRAREDEQRLKNEAEAYANKVVPNARGEAARQVAEAQGYKYQVVARAEGDAQRFDQLLTQYKLSPEVTRKRLYLDTLQTVLSNTSKVIVDGKAGNQMLYLPLQQLLQAGKKSADADANASSGTAADTDSSASSSSNGHDSNPNSRFDQAARQGRSRN